MERSFDQTSFIEALTRHQPALEAFCHANLANREDARDVLQAACVMLWQKASDWNPETEFLPWAFTVARFTVLSHIRDRMRDRLVFDEDVVLAMASQTEAAANDFDDRREALRHCLQKLSADQRRLLQDHYGTQRSAAHGFRCSQNDGGFFREPRGLQWNPLWAATAAGIVFGVHCVWSTLYVGGVWVYAIRCRKYDHVVAQAF